MGTLKITKTKKVGLAIKSSSVKCPRCYGCLINGWDTENEITNERCVLCGYRHELRTQNNKIDSSLIINEMAWEF